MNNSSIRLFGIIFIILLFCLSPLAAINLGQGDNSSQINNNRDLNDSVIADADHDKDNGIKKDNDVEIQSASVNDSNSINNLQASDPKISMETHDCEYGESPIVKIYIKHKNFAYDLDAEIHVQGVDYHKIYKQALKGGNAGNVITLDKNMPVGTYTVTYNFVPSEPDYFIPVTVQDTFTVNKCDAKIECDIDDVVECGLAPIIETHCTEHFKNGTAYITSPYFSKVYKFDASLNNNVVFIYERLLPGDYTCNLYYPGDSNHNPQNTTLTFKVIKTNPELTVKAEDIVKGCDLHVNVHTKQIASGGNVTCEVMPAVSSDSSLSSKYNSQTIHIDNNGVGNATIDCQDLPPGKYRICTSYNGNDYVNYATVFTNFQVKESV